jgi:hypothetical protein
VAARYHGLAGPGSAGRGSQTRLHTVSRHAARGLHAAQTELRSDSEGAHEAEALQVPQPEVQPRRAKRLLPQEPLHKEKPPHTAGARCGARDEDRRSRSPAASASASASSASASSASASSASTRGLVAVIEGGASPVASALPHPKTSSSSAFSPASPPSAPAAGALAFSSAAAALPPPRAVPDCEVCGKRATKVCTN